MQTKKILFFLPYFYVNLGYHYIIASYPMHLNGILVVANAVERLKICQLFANIENITLLDEFDTAVGASEFLTYNSVDFIVLKTDLPVYDGFDFIENLKHNVEIILIIKEPTDALKAFELGLIDCLPPSFKRDRLELGLSRIREKKIIEPQSSEAHDSTLVVRCNLKNEKIYLNAILWIEAMGDYIRIQTPTRKYVILSTMKQFMSRLPEHQFFRTHKSFIVNMDKIERYTPSEVEIAGELLPLSRSRKNEFQIRFSIN